MAERKKYFIDFEASSLSHDSYPIEIAWGSDMNNIESYLISPETVSHWTDWSNQSQKIHGIPHNELIESGEAPGLVCEKIYATLDNQHVYSDAPAFDMDWLRKLFDSASLPMPDFIIKDIDELLIAEIACSGSEVDDIDRYLELLKRKARKITEFRHRAFYDVEYLIVLMNLCRGKNN